MKSILVFLLLYTGFLFGQERDSIVVVYHISDQKEFAVQGAVAKIFQGNSNYEIVSNEQGEAFCNVARYGEIKTTFIHPEYSKLTTIEQIYKTTQLDTIHFDVKLTSIKSLNLAEIVILAPGVPEIVYSSSKNSVHDFQIIDDNNIILLTYPKQLKKGSQLLLYDMYNNAKDSVLVAEEAVDLTRDYLGRVYLIHTQGCKQILIKDNSIEMIDVNRHYLERNIMPVIGTANNKLYFSTYDPLYPAFDYYFYDEKDSVYQKFASVCDNVMMAQYRSEFRFADLKDPVVRRRRVIAKNYELETGVDAEVYYGRKYFTNTEFYEPPFAPMFQIRDSLYLFDYHSDSLKIYNTEGKIQHEVQITHDYNGHKLGWQKKLLHDRIKNKIYALFEWGGFYYLHKVNLISGELSKPIKLNHRYTEEIQVYNGFIYYVYRPFESYQKKYFWREKIPS